ncbi:hypothetical protein [Oryzobacter terrae]|uniref:hypothetical protein n=1 Tax=Oryzobacter terrae TaxID=1620385 RepID=UPI0036713756
MPDDAALRSAFSQSLPPRVVVTGGVWASLLVACYLALAQLDALVAQVVADGRTVSLSGLTGLGRGDASAWDALAARMGQVPGLGGWVTAYALVDVLFAVLYAGAAALLLVRAAGSGAAGRRWYLAALVGIGVAGVADVAESVLLVDLTDGAGHGGTLVAVSWAKWGGLVLTVVVSVIGARQSHDHPRGATNPTPFAGGVPPASPPGLLGRVARGLYTHRFSLLVVVPFAALGLAQGSDILDQLPDVQRQWVDDSPGTRVGLSGLLTVLVGVVVLVVGRLRSHYVAARVLPNAAPYRVAALLPWFVTAAVIAGGAVASWVLLGSWEVIWPRFAIALLVPFAIWFGSVVLRWWLGEPPWGPYRRPVSAEQARTTTLVGDVLGVLVVVIPGLGLVRAFTAPVALGTGGWNVALLVLGLLTAVLTWPLALVLAHLLAARARPTTLTALIPGEELDAAGRRRSRRNAWVLLVLGIALFVGIGLQPREVTESLGVVEVILLAVTAVALPLGATVILLQGGGAPDLLSRPMTPVLRTAPVMTLIVLTAVVVGLTGSDAGVHGLRALGTDADPTARPTLVGRLEALAGEQQCGAPLPGTAHTVRPVFVLAAEGGGIRAAAWTALGADALREAGGPCADALMSSGASGGAVGLTVTSFAETDGRAFSAVERMATPDGLGVAVAGLLVRDPLRSVTGIPYPTAGEGGWVDRGGLIEREWEQVVPGLADPFLGEVRARVPGALVLNSTSVSTHCRTMLSQVTLDPDPDPLGCQSSTSVPDGVDLLATVRVGCTDRVPSMRASTVSLLASRFPYVTPSGVVTTGCPEGADSPDAQQLVDGGYADNDGLGTLVDLSGQWMPALRAHNEDVLDGSTSAPLLVPVLLYLDNGSGSDLTASAAGATNEVLVPLLTKGAATATLSSTDTQLHRGLAAFATSRAVPGCLPADPDDPASPGNPSSGDPVCGAVDAWRGSAVKVFFQPTRPSISAPLGWVLSNQSLRTLRCARDDQVVAAGVTAIGGPGSCADDAVVAPQGETANPDAPTGCRGDRAAQDASPLARKGYGTMLAALCLLREARDAQTP